MAINDVILRAIKGNELTHDEMDANTVALNRKLWLSTVAPAVTDDASKSFQVGAIWIDFVANKFYKCTDTTIGVAVWEEIPINQVKDKFTQLTDTPSAFVANKFLRVNPTGDALVLVDVSFLNLSDTPASLTANKWFKVNATGDGIVEVNAPLPEGTADVTANRPTSPMIGQFFKDTTLGIPIWWDGTNWINHLGATV